MSRTLIVTADDVGLHRGMTLGALAAHERGVVTACSVVASGPDFDDAAALLRRTPTLAVGAHLTLVGTRPLADPARIPSLLGPDGSLLAGFPAFMRRYVVGGVRLAEVELELRSQLEAITAAGLEVTYLNSHQHLHALPGIFAIVCALAEEIGARHVRLPLDRGPRPRRLGRVVAMAGLGALGRLARRRRARDAGVTIDNGTIGIAAAGHLSLDLALALLPHVSGVTELVCHPGLDQLELASEFAWGYEWERELHTLTDPRLRRAITEAGIALASFREKQRIPLSVIQVTW